MNPCKRSCTWQMFPENPSMDVHNYWPGYNGAYFQQPFNFRDSHYSNEILEVSREKAVAIRENLGGNVWQDGYEQHMAAYYAAQKYERMEKEREVRRYTNTKEALRRAGLLSFAKQVSVLQEESEHLQLFIDKLEETLKLAVETCLDQECKL